MLILNSKSPVCLPQVSLHDFHRVHSIHSAQLLDDAGCLGGDYDMPGVTGASPTCCCSRNLPALFLSDLVLHHPKRRLEKNFYDYLDATGRFLELTEIWIIVGVMDNVQFNSDSEVGDDCHDWHIILYAGLFWFPWFPFAPVNKSPSFKGSAKWVRVHGFFTCRRSGSVSDKAFYSSSRMTMMMMMMMMMIAKRNFTVWSILIMVIVFAAHLISFASRDCNPKIKVEQKQLTTKNQRCLQDSAGVVSHTMWVVYVLEELGLGFLMQNDLQSIPRVMSLNLSTG